MQTAQGSLTIINPHTLTPEVYWNGRLVSGVKRIHVHSDEDESRVKLVVNGNDDETYAQMIVAGVHVKKAVV